MLNQVSWAGMTQVRRDRTANNSGRDGLAMWALVMKMSFDSAEYKGKHTRGANSYMCSITYEITSDLSTEYAG